MGLTKDGSECFAWMEIYDHAGHNDIRHTDISWEYVLGLLKGVSAGLPEILAPALQK